MKVYNLHYVTELSIICSSHICFRRQRIHGKLNRNKREKGYFYQYYNQLSACIIRIRETVGYLSTFEFRKTKTLPQAFDFYEFINCISIIKGCVEALFKIFGKELRNHYPKNRVFTISNRTKKSDIDFFNFVRSAALAHPMETTRYRGITKVGLEVYPYVLWCNPIISTFNKDKPEKADLELHSWSSKTAGKTKRYYLYSHEFEEFVNALLDSLSVLIDEAKVVKSRYIEKIRCKRLKGKDNFVDITEYCMYLRRIIIKKNKVNNDGGLLLATHLLSNPKISLEFKNYIEKRLFIIRGKMMSDINSIDYDEIFSELSLYDILKHTDQGNYISEKFYDYLRPEVKTEIEKNEECEIDFEYIKESKSQNLEDRDFCVFLLLTAKNVLFKDEELKEIKTYCDIYEMTLEEIFKKSVFKENHPNE